MEMIRKVNITASKSGLPCLDECGGPEHQHNARRRKPQRGREKILRRDAAERKGGAEAKERARHGSSFSPSR